jgi:hypothetical protein
MPENLPEVLTEVISYNLKTRKIWFEAGGEDVSISSDGHNIYRATAANLIPLSA